MSTSMSGMELREQTRVEQAMVVLAASVMLAFSFTDWWALGLALATVLLVVAVWRVYRIRHSH
ncbi:MAG: hypothetical protein L0K86_20390 [Actinomycetia bacterium]|nr:hypothetical protein [Actinomycetes bacterium]